jgi:hypothetical protein
MNSPKQGQPKTLKNDPQASGTGTDFLASQGRVLVARVSVGQVKSKINSQFFSTSLGLQEIKKN